MAYLEVQQLSKTFGKQLLLKDISFSLNQAETLVILGPSGAGKTTILRMIAGLEEPSSGCIYLDGECIDTIPASKRGISMIFQDAALFTHTRVKENIIYGLAKLGYSKEKMDFVFQEIAKDLHMEHLLQRYPGTLSAGEKQRVGIARALIRKPRLLLMDEPFSNLDYQLKQEFAKEMKEIQEKWNMTILLVTHDIEEARQYATKILVLEDGICQPLEQTEFGKNLPNR